MGLFAKKASQSFIVVNGRKFDSKTGDEIVEKKIDTEIHQSKTKQSAKAQPPQSTNTHAQSARRLSQVLDTEATKIPKKSVEQIKAHPGSSNHTDLRKINKKAVQAKADQTATPLSLDKSGDEQFEKAEKAVKLEIKSLEHDKQQAELKAQEAAMQPAPVIKKFLL